MEASLKNSRAHPAKRHQACPGNVRQDRLDSTRCLRGGRASIRPDIRYLTLILTARCNLNCVYCYRGNQKSNDTMSEQVIDQAIALTSNAGGPLHIQISGGEPTLVPALVAHTARAVKTMRPAATLGMQTNGTRIDKSIARLAKQYSIQVGISLDGPARIHNQIRGAAKETLLGMRILEDLGIDFRVTTVVTGHNAEYLGSIALLLGAFSNARGLGLDLLVQKGSAMKNHVPAASPASIARASACLMANLGQINARRKVPITFREAEHVRQAANRTYHHGFCHGETGHSAAVTPAGEIYACGQTVGDPRFFAGTVDEPDFGELKRLGALAGSNTRTDCSGCSLNSRCPGDCPSRRFYNDKGNHDTVCAMYRTIRQELRG